MQPLLARLPISEVLNCLEPNDRELSALISKTWNSEELLTRNLYYFEKLSALPTCPSQVKSSSIDYRARYYGVIGSNLEYEDSDDDDEDDKRFKLEEFRRNYKVLIIGTLNDSEDVSEDVSEEGDTEVTELQLFQHEAIITVHESESLILEFDTPSDPVAVPRRRFHGRFLHSLNLSVWIVDKEDNKMFLFWEQPNVLALWPGFNHQGLATEEDFDDERQFEGGDGFDGGFVTSHYDLGSSGRLNGKAPWHDSKQFEIYSGEIHYKFQKPILPNLPTLGIGMNEDAQDLAIDEWYRAQDETDHLLVRLKMMFNKKDKDCHHDHYFHDYYMYDEPEKPYTLSDLNDSLRNIDWY
jgi:hypothetical protein